MSYSQNNEEIVIQDLLAKTGLSRGTFLDIGAYDGKTFSNTLKLAEQGWSGVCIEPSPCAFSGLLKVHGNNPNVVLVNTAVTQRGGWLEFFDSGGDAVSSSDPAHVTKWSQDGGVKFTKFLLRSISVDELFIRFGTNFEFINLDVESLNMALFQELPWNALDNTRIICVEHDGHADLMLSIAQRYGFSKIDQNAENIILSRPV